MTKSALFSAVLTLFLIFPGIFRPCMAADAPHVQVRLIPESNVVLGGENLIVLIEETIDPGWHTYWVNPGDSGAAPRIKWTLPEGFAAGDILWPTPHPVSLGGLVSYGYEGTATLGQSILVPDQLPEGTLHLQADLEILVCKDICIPEKITQTLALNDSAAQPADAGSQVDQFYKTLPVKTEWAGQYARDGEDLVLEIAIPNPITIEGAKPDSFVFMPEEWGLIKYGAKTRTAFFSPEKIILRQTGDDRPLEDIGPFKAVVTFERTDGQIIAQSVRLMQAAPPAGAKAFVASLKKNTDLNSTGTDVSGTTLIQAIILAMLGGLVLNLMPCVFPVLSIKALSLIKLREKGWTAASGSGLAYTAGVLLSFAVIGWLLLSLRLAGNHVGWGFQLQNPVMVLALSYLLFVIGLNLSGLYDIGGSFSNIGSSLVTRHPWAESFLTGILATIVATPCTAPFMAGALGFALIQPPVIAMAVFLSLGLGLALPYLVLSMVPQLTARLPRPGLWMAKFREILAFPMYGFTAWLVWVFTMQTGPDGLLWASMGMVAIAFALWLLAHRPLQRIRRLVIVGIALLSLLFAAYPFVNPPVLQRQAQVEPEHAAGVFSQEKLDLLLQSDRPVFVYMTAAWCITCKINEKIALHAEATKALFLQKKVAVLEGDWTAMNPDITDFLKKWGRSGVPLYIYYAAPDQTGQRPAPVILPQILTPGIIRQAAGGKA